MIENGRLAGGAAASTAVEERTFENLIGRLMSASGSFAEARARLEQFGNRLSGPGTGEINKASDKPMAPVPSSIEARLAVVINELEAHANGLHSQIGRLERSA